MRLVGIIIVCAVLGVAGYFGWQQFAGKNASAADQRPLSTATVEERDISFAITAAGEIGPADQVSVRPEINGRIAELPVDIGDKVKAGQLLCSLDDTDLQIERESQTNQIAGAMLQMEASRLNVEKTEREYKRNKDLFEGNLIPQEIYDNARTEFHLAKNQFEISRNLLERAQKNLKMVEDRISKTRIIAPFDCTVLTRPVSLGQTVSGAAGFNSGTEVMTIANLNDMIITAHINQADVTRMKAGQPVEIQVESVPGLRMGGTVQRIAPQAIIKNGIKGFSARIAIENIDPRVRPGMTSILSIPVASVESALSVPLPAVFSEKNERFVYVKDGDTFARRSVQIGISDYSHAEIQSGVTNGEIVALEQPSDVKEEPPKSAEKPKKARAAVTMGSNSPAAKKSS